ncbi:MAG: response regulator [Endomicrobium sp.]|jgi:two-component system response regulator (stage 0 sporulation protein F)|nr:response regulator [Endomicrobium sp.]
MDMNKKLNILIADDEEGLRFSMASILEIEGHTVQIAQDGKEALEFVKNGVFDIAFFDIRMPGLNGVDALKEMKKISPETITVMMTAYAMNDLIRESIQEGAFACISKPFEIEDVLSTIREIASKPTAFLVDVDAESSGGLSQILKSYGYTVLSAADSSKAFAFASRRLPEIMFTSLSPSNAEFIEKIKASGKSDSLITLGEQSLAVSGIKNIELPVTRAELEMFLSRSKKKKVAIISSDTINSNNLKISLVAKGYDASYYQTSESFFRFPDWFVYEAVICDLQGECDPEHFIKKLKEKELKRKLIVLTDFENQKNEILKENAVFFQKSSDNSQLVKLLED